MIEKIFKRVKNEHYYELQDEVKKYIVANYTSPVCNEAPQLYDICEDATHPCDICEDALQTYDVPGTFGESVASVVREPAQAYESAQAFGKAFCDDEAMVEKSAGKSVKRSIRFQAKAAMECSAKSIEEAVAGVGQTFAEKLMILIKEHGMTNAQFYTRANIRKSHFSKIKNNPDYQPKKSTVFACAIALELGCEGAKDLLARAGYAISPSSKFDLAIQYFIENGVYDIIKIDTVLYDMELPLIGDYE